MKKEILQSFLFLFLTLLFPSAYGQITGIEAYYSFSGNSNDESGNGNNAQLIGGATANSFLKVGNNTSNYLLLPSNIINGKEDFSVSFKIQFKSFHKSGSFPTNHILTGSSTSLDRFGLSYERINLTWRLALNGLSYSFPDLLTADVWFCVTISREGNQAKLYVDGLLVGTATVNTTPISCTSLLLGQEEDCSGGCFAKNQCTNGKIDDLTFYDHALTPTDVKSVCSNATEKIEVLEINPSTPLFYPNPAHDFINIPFESDNIQTVEIYNMIGEKVAQYNHSSTLDIANIRAGIYLIRVIGLSGEIELTGKLIKE